MTQDQPHDGDGREHVLVVTVQRCPACPSDGLCEDCQDDPDVSYDIECPGVAVSHCNLWLECEQCSKHTDALTGDEVSDYLDDIYETSEAHGVEHQVFDGVPCTETDQCYVQSSVTSGSGIDSAYDISTKPGRYPVDWETGDPGDIYLIPIHETREATR